MKTQISPLLDILNQIPDPRQSKGKRYPLGAILALVCAASLCGYKSYTAIGEWGKNYGKKVMKALGFNRKHLKPPCASTLHYLFRRLDQKLLESKLSQWTEELLSILPPYQAQKEEEKEEAFAIDGKTLRGSQKQGASCCHLLSIIHGGSSLRLNADSGWSG